MQQPDLMSTIPALTLCASAFAVLTTDHPTLNGLRD